MGPHINRNCSFTTIRVFIEFFHSCNFPHFFKKVHSKVFASSNFWFVKPQPFQLFTVLMFVLARKSPITSTCRSCNSNKWRKMLGLMCFHSSKMPLLTGQAGSASSKLSGPSTMCPAPVFLNHMFRLLFGIGDLIHTSSTAVILLQVHSI